MSLKDPKQEIVEHFLNNSLFLSPDMLDDLGSIKAEELSALVSERIKAPDFVFINKDVFEILKKNDSVDFNWHEFERSKVLCEKGRNCNIYLKFIDYLKKRDSAGIIKAPDAEILFSYGEAPKKKEAQDFVALFNARFKAIEAMLRNRQELQNVMSISRVRGKKDRDTVSIIGLVSSKQLTKNGNFMLTVEDPTGIIKVLVNKNNRQAYEMALDIVHDEVIGIAGVNGDNIVFANSVIWPDIPIQKELRKCPEESYAICLSDFHVGSYNFLEENFIKFLKWLNGKAGNERQKNIAKKVKYIFIVGDLVDGVGIYPGQDSELKIKDIYEQYNACAELLKQIPKRIRIIISPGNHDAMRISEPQPVLTKDFAAAIWDLPNASMVSNPALVNIARSEGFSGFDVLIYHGYSFDYFIANVESIRNRGGYDRADLMMKFLLQKRHLAPTHASTLYIPDVNQDPLVISSVPDFFLTGHIHKSSVSLYRNVTMVCGSCWQSKTPFQEKVGHHPEPCRVPIINLQTRDVKILKFDKA